MNDCMMNAATVDRKLASVITATSRLRTWLSSWASTALTSSVFSRFISPFVTAMTEWCWLRPVANALGTSVGTIATRGFGMPASDLHSSSTIWCSSGACSGDTTFARVLASTILSEKKYWMPSITAAMIINIVGSIPSQYRNARNAR